MTYDASSQAQVDKKKAAERKDLLVERLVLQTLMSHAQGRRYIWMRLEEANIFAQTLRFGREGYAGTAFEEGKRALGLKLLAAVTRYAPEEYMTMTKENTTVLEQEDERSADDTHGSTSGHTG